MLKVYLIYSNFCNHCKLISDNIKILQEKNVNIICIDDQHIRSKILSVNINVIPYLLTYNNHNHKTIYIGKDAIQYIKNLINNVNHNKIIIDKYKKHNNKLQQHIKQRDDKINKIMNLINSQPPPQQPPPQQPPHPQQPPPPQQPREQPREQIQTKQVTFSDDINKTYLDDDMFEMENENKIVTNMLDMDIIENKDKTIMNTLEERARNMQKLRD